MCEGAMQRAVVREAGAGDRPVALVLADLAIFDGVVAAFALQRAHKRGETISGMGLPGIPRSCPRTRCPEVSPARRAYDRSPGSGTRDSGGPA